MSTKCDVRRLSPNNVWCPQTVSKQCVMSADCLQTMCDVCRLSPNNVWCQQTVSKQCVMSADCLQTMCDVRRLSPNNVLCPQSLQTMCDVRRLSPNNVWCPQTVSKQCVVHNGLCCDSDVSACFLSFRVCVCIYIYIFLWAKYLSNFFYLSHLSCNTITQCSATIGVDICHGQTP